jgi:hypothetical protein
MQMSRTDLIQYANSFGLNLVPDTPYSLTLVVVDALNRRTNDGLASPNQIERLLGHGYSPEIVLSLSWAHANETLRILADNVRKPEESQ